MERSPHFGCLELTLRREDRAFENARHLRLDGHPLRIFPQHCLPSQLIRPCTLGTGPGWTSMSIVTSYLRLVQGFGALGIADRLPHTRLCDVEDTQHAPRLSHGLDAAKVVREALREFSQPSQLR